MRRLKGLNFYVLMFLLFAFNAVQAQSYSYVYRGQTVELQVVPGQLIVQFKQKQTVTSARRLLLRKIPVGFRNRLLDRQGRFQLLSLTRPLSETEREGLIESLGKNENLLSAAPVLRQPNGKVRFFYNRTFLVRFKREVSLNQILAFNGQHNVLILKELPDNTFLLQAAVGMDGLQASAQYLASEAVRWAQPNFYYLDWGLLNATVNDPLWPQQWAHKNTGQAVASGAKSQFPPIVRGIVDADMDVDRAWDVLVENGGQAGGSSDILVAMLDSGIDLNHPDLQDNLFSSGKDFSPDQGSDANDVQGHGTSTAGIVAAVGDNGLGVAGIAFNVKLLPVKIFTTYGMADDADIAQAIDYAWQNGADILSNSWSGSTQNSVIDDALHRAKTQGRDGKGCLIVFSSGNEGHGSVSYPAYLDDVMAVGASNMFDEKKNPGSHDFQWNWGGNYGEALDLVAPTIVYSTDITGSAGYDDGDYFDHFGGTSAACPQVSGVAALMLSANGNLTSDDLQSLLQKSADKIDRYPFDLSGWNKHVGYGRVNAYRAVRLALGQNGDAPLIAHTPLQSTSDVGTRTAVAFISDDDGLAADSLHEPALFYRTVFQGDTSVWRKIIDTDGPNGDEYDFVIPAQSWGTQVEYYIKATDSSPDSLTATFPSYGKSQSVPTFLLHYFVGDFETISYNSSDVPVSIADDNVYYTSSLTVDDTRPIVDVNATISISKHIEDLAVALEAPDSTASGIVSHNGQPGDEYANTTLDDEATMPISQGSSPYSGSFQPDNALWVFDGLKGRGTWTLWAYDNTYYNNGGSIDGWYLDITYMKPINPPVVSDIPDQTVDEGASFAQFDLDDYVTDADNSDDEITWTYSGNTDLLVSIDPNTHIATISAPDSEWNGSETITFTATDPTLLKDSDPATFTVNAVNDAPVVSDIPDQTIDEGQSFASIHLDDYVSDADNAPSEMTWTYSGNTDLQVSIDTNRVATISPPDSNWNGSETITFTATDPGGLSDSDPATFTVNAVNDAPVITSLPDTVAVQGQLYRYQVTATDADSGDVLHYRLLQAPAFLSIDSVSGLISGTPGNSDVGKHDVTLQVHDSSWATDVQSYQLTVKNTNDAPVVSDIPDQTIDEGQSFAPIHLDDYVSDADNAPSEMTWTYSGNKELQVNIDANRVATISPPDSNWNGSETVTFTATDPGGLSAADSAVFTVRSVNDAPAISPSLPMLEFNEDDSMFVARRFWYPFVDDAETADSLLQYRLGQGRNIRVTLSNNGWWLRASPNWFGEDSLLLTVSDGFLSDSARFKVKVKAVNDAPQIENLPDSLVFNKTDTLYLILKGSDVDDPFDSLRWYFSVSDTAVYWQFDVSRCQLSLYTNRFIGYAELFVRLEDTHGAYSADTSLIHIKDTGTGMSAGKDLRPKNFSLAQNYPNPFNPATTIPFTLKEAGEVVLELFALNGKRLVLVNRNVRSAGRHRVKISLRNLSSGIYFYRLTVFKNGRILFRQTRKMVFLK